MFKPITLPCTISPVFPWALLLLLYGCCHCCFGAIPSYAQFFLLAVLWNTRDQITYGMLAMCRACSALHINIALAASGFILPSFGTCPVEGPVVYPLSGKTSFSHLGCEGPPRGSLGSGDCRWCSQALNSGSMFSWVTHLPVCLVFLHCYLGVGWGLGYAPCEREKGTVIPGSWHLVGDL